MWRTIVRSLVLASPEGFCHTADSRRSAPEGANECTFEQWVAAQNSDVVLQNNDFVVPIMDGLGLAIVVTRS